jgi:hypothetical protein
MVVVGGIVVGCEVFAEDVVGIGLIVDKEVMTFFEFTESAELSEWTSFASCDVLDISFTGVEFIALLLGDFFFFVRFGDVFVNLFAGLSPLFFDTFTIGVGVILLKSNIIYYLYILYLYKVILKKTMPRNSLN